MKNSVCVISFFLLACAGICIQVNAADCYNDQDCIDKDCDEQIPYCRIQTHHHGEKKRQHNSGTCDCRVKDCYNDQDCIDKDCDEHKIPYCLIQTHHHHDKKRQHHMGTCDCRVKDCYNDQDCMDKDCDEHKIPYCLIHADKKRQHHRGTCECRETTQSSVVAQSYMHCNQHTDCNSQKCSTDKPTPYCKHDYAFIIIEIGRHCDCTAMTVATTTTTVRSTTLTPLSTSSACHTNTDCSGRICPSDKHPYCKIDRYSSTCHCTVCTEHNHCFCPPGLIGHCHFDYLRNSHSCVCGIAPVVTTTTSVPPPTVTQLSTSACHAHTDCCGHICPSDKHPYCKIDRYSTTCHCTDCTEHKHCFCPQGLIGQCHFDYIHNVYSCVCGLAPDTTTTVSTSSTSKSVPTTTFQSTSVSSKSTTNSTPIPTTTQSITLSLSSTSKSTSRMVTTTSSSSVSSSTSATSPTTTSVPSTNPGIRCPTCDESLNCMWNQTCYPEESCMIRSRYHGTKFTTHCTRKEDCSFIKNLMPNGEVFCCNDRVCLQTYLGV